MKYIANILTDEPFLESEFYNVVRNTSDLVKTIPTLIVGWDKTKELYPNASIIEFKVTDNVYWTYGKYEKRDKYEANVKRFMDLAFKKFIDSVSYVFYDVITESPKRFDGFIGLFQSNINKIVYIVGDMMYVYWENSKKIVGISLRDCDYIDETYKKRIFSAIYNNASVKILKNNIDITKEARFKTRGITYILPYLCS